jgi:hypothetical protein
MAICVGLLNVAENTALNLVKTAAYSDPSPNPVEFSIARYRGINKFDVKLYRLKQRL